MSSAADGAPSRRARATAPAARPATSSLDLTVLRWLVLIAGWACVAHVAWRGHWEGWLTHNDHTWIAGLEYAPIWDPPPIPGYGLFKERIELSEPFPTGRQEFRIERRLRLDIMLVNLMLDLWVVTASAGLIYLVIRRNRIDQVLHCALVIAVFLTFAGIMCFGLSVLSGGWAAKVAETFGVMGFLVGLLVGLMSFRHMTRRRQRRVPRPAFRPYGL